MYILLSKLASNLNTRLSHKHADLTSGYQSQKLRFSGVTKLPGSLSSRLDLACHIDLSPDPLAPWGGTRLLNLDAVKEASWASNMSNWFSGEMEPACAILYTQPALEHPTWWFPSGTIGWTSSRGIGRSSSLPWANRHALPLQHLPLDAHCQQSSVRTRSGVPRNSASECAKVQFIPLKQLSFRQYLNGKILTHTHTYKKNYQCNSQESLVPTHNGNFAWTFQKSLIKAFLKSKSAAAIYYTHWNLKLNLYTMKNYSPWVLQQSSTSSRHLHILVNLKLFRASFVIAHTGTGAELNQHGLRMHLPLDKHAHLGAMSTAGILQRVSTPNGHFGSHFQSHFSSWMTNMYHQISINKYTVLIYNGIRQSSLRSW